MLNEKKRQDIQWDDLKALLRAKTVMIALMAMLSGVALLSGGQLLTGLAQTIVLSIGVTLVTSSVFSVISEAALRLDTLEPIIEEMRSIRRSLSSTTRGAEIVENRRSIDFGELIGKCVGDLVIVGISSNDILSPQNVDRIRDRMRSGELAAVRIALLNPRCVAAKTRATANAYADKKEVSTKIQATLADLKAISAELDGRQSQGLQLVLLNYLPTISLVVFPEVAIVTPVITNATGGRSPSIIVRKEFAGSIFDTYRAHALGHFALPKGAEVAVDTSARRRESTSRAST